MSGGHFNYEQFQIEQIANEIETSPRPPIVKKKNLMAWKWHGNRGSCHSVLASSIEREHQRYMVHKNMREVTDI